MPDPTPTSEPPSLDIAGERRPRGDPLEQLVADALDRARIWYTTPDQRRDATGLDFRLGNGVEIEVKAMHTERSARQLASAANVILLQGPEAVKAFCALVDAANPPHSNRRAGGG